MLENKQGMVSKYKTLNQAHRTTMAENQELAAELALLKANGTAPPVTLIDPQTGLLRDKTLKQKAKIAALRNASHSENQLLATNA